MSQASSSFTDSDSQENVAVSLDYIPTKEEKRVFRECNQESFWYRSVPISVISMAVTQALITRGALTSSTGFGSLPKVAFAGVCGYLGGKISYMKTCQEKFKNLSYSPLGEALRQRQRHVPLQFPQDQSEFVDPNKSTSEPMFQTERPFTSQKASYLYKEDPKRQGVRYEELRSRNRENYEITLTQKTDALLKSSSSHKSSKKYLYGDVWEE
ncbi:OCIA domain-containing protein 1-like [Alosa sapidissima]|uniref:OCIA domain-containing protein 1-like n=1 Tax=Alosa sapidissima TaxID=34773 RepID=UPI001C09699F|nr:OCIA domain-containing protein 1-like [Alosa sapidissima]